MSAITSSTTTYRSALPSSSVQVAPMNFLRIHIVIMLTLLGLTMRRAAVTAFSTTRTSMSVRPIVATRLRSSWTDDDNGDSFVDDSGRKIRAGSRATAPPADDGWYDDQDDFQPKRQSSNRRSSPRGSNNSWEDFDPWIDNGGNKDDDGWGGPPRHSNDRPQRQRRPSSRRDNDFGRGGGRVGRDFGGRGGDRDFGSRRRRDGDFNDRPPRRSFDDRSPRRSFDNSRGGPRNNKKPFNKNKKDDSGVRSINMNSLEGAGFVHLYGLSSVLNALSVSRRDLSLNLEKTSGDGSVDEDRFKKLDDSFDPDFDDLDDEDDDETFGSDSPAAPKADVKPQAQFRSYLFVQERAGGGGGRRGSKASAAQEVMELAESKGVPIAHVDKGILNTLSGNRPHQGFVLRCGKLYFEGMSRIPTPDETDAPNLWLVLDEVVDPQNLGALLRSAYFLGGGGGASEKPKMGVLVCSKNSAPPSPVVSAASAGALELLEVHSTANLPRTLNQAREDGFRIIGAAAAVPTRDDDTEDGPSLYDLQDLPTPGADGDNRPVILVLGSEGHGLRTLVAKACTEFVRIPSGIAGGDAAADDTDEDASKAGVDSLNVSVTGGIMLWHLLNGGTR